MKELTKNLAKITKKLLKRKIVPVLEFEILFLVNDLSKIISLQILELNLKGIPLEGIVISFLLAAREKNLDYDNYLIEIISKINESLVPAIPGLYVFLCYYCNKNLSFVADFKYGLK